MCNKEKNNMERIKEFKVEHEAFNKLGLGQPRELYAIITDNNLFEL